MTSPPANTTLMVAGLIGEGVLVEIEADAEVLNTDVLNTEVLNTEVLNTEVLNTPARAGVMRPDE